MRNPLNAYNESWVIPPKANAEFVCQMEEVLQLYTSKHELDYPIVCFDETSKQLISEKRSTMSDQILTRMGDGERVCLSADQVKEDILTGTQDACKASCSN